MYESKLKNSKNIYLLFIIMALVALFTIISYTLILDNKQYVYSSEITGTQLSISEKSTENIEEILERVTESTVGISKVKDIGKTAFLEKSVENLNLGSGVIISEKRIYINK